MPRFPILETLSGDPPKPVWLLPNMMTTGSMVCMGGTAGTGKSFLSYHLAIGLSCGLSTFGNPAPAASRVLVFDQENGAHDLAAYLFRIWAGLGKPDLATLALNLRIEHFSLVAPSPNHYGEMTAAAIEHKPALIIIDTATPVLRIADENSNSEASQAIRQLRAVRAAASPETSMLILKHARWSNVVNKGDKSHLDIRGAKTWSGELDAVWFLRAKAGHPPASGLRQTILSPDKVRAWGLRESLAITPSIANGGVSLSAEPYQAG